MHGTAQRCAKFPIIRTSLCLQIEIPAARWSDGAWVDKERRRLVQSFLAGPLGREFRFARAMVLRSDGGDCFRRSSERARDRLRLHG